jgi:alpha-L-rhamnosidase
MIKIAKIYIFIFFLFAVSLAFNERGIASMTVQHLQCENMVDALVAKTTPRFSWEPVSAQRGQRQTAWQLIVSDEKVEIEAKTGNCWDSGKIKGSQTFNINYGGSRLTSFKKYYWRVRIWDREDKESDWSATASFVTGAFSEEDWKAVWIGDRPEKALDYPLLYKHIGYLSAYTDDPQEEKWIQIDLGKTKIFDHIRIYPAENNIRKIRDYYFPLAFRIVCSNDGSTWQTCVEKEPAVLPQGKVVDFSFDRMQARFVRFIALKLQRYDHRIYDFEDRGDADKQYAFSLAEMEILRDGRVISRGLPVMYKDAVVKIDREDGYDPEMLTDGITNTPPYPERRRIPPSPLLRKTFTLKTKPKQALAFVSALGVYELLVNESPADSRVLAPEWTDYHQRVQYQAYDVTPLLDSGINVIGAQLADGWYAGMLGPTRWSPYYPKRGAYGLDRRLFFQMVVEYADGEKEIVVSDDSWKIYRDGPLRMADNFLGETYDANKEVKRWTTAAFDASAWQNVVVDKEVKAHLVAQVNQPIKVIETLKAISVAKTKQGNYLFDVGENIAGWCQISLKGEPGDMVVLRHGEILDDSGELYTENLADAVQRDTVILGAEGILTYEPRFTYHGFRYVEVSGLHDLPAKGILSARVIASDLPRRGSFSCSNPMLNQLYKNINRSHISNMHGIPTDCPQRDERCGWMGDAFIFARTSMYNRDMAAFYRKWITDIMDAQSRRGTFPDIAPHPFANEKHMTNAPGWADAGIRMPYLMYETYGDIEIIENHFGACERYIENIRRTNPGLIWKHGLGNNYGDWLNGNTLQAEGFPKTGAQIPSEVFSTIMFYNSVNMVAGMAEWLGRTDKGRYYRSLAKDIKTAFVSEFIDREGNIEGDAQACYAMALHYGIYPADREEVLEKRMLEKFIPYQGRMNTGFHSTLPLMKELVKRGYAEKAYQLLESKAFPSWGYSIEQGATSIWERWDGFVKGRGFQSAGMNSFNHYAFGAVGEWMIENILGIQIDPQSPGFRHFILKPLPGGTLTWAKGSYHSISGKIDSGWELDKNRFTFHFTIPANTTATVYIPCRAIGDVMLDDKKLTDIFEKGKIAYKNNYAIVEMESGMYQANSILEKKKMTGSQD